MGQLFAVAMLLYLVVAAALVPVAFVDFYLQARDCRAENHVDQCELVFQPAQEQPQ